MFAHKGHIKIHPVTAHIMRDGEHIGEELEPKLLINFGEDEWHSDARKGRNPEWAMGCHWEHHVADPQNDIHFKIIDHRGMFHKDEPLAHVCFKIAELCHGEGEHEKEIILHHQGQEACKLIVKIHFKKEN